MTAICYTYIYVYVYMYDSKQVFAKWCLFSFGWVGCLIVFNVPSTARSFRYGTPIYRSLLRT